MYYCSLSMYRMGNEPRGRPPTSKIKHVKIVAAKLKITKKIAPRKFATIQYVHDMYYCSLSLHIYPSMTPCPPSPGLTVGKWSAALYFLCTHNYLLYFMVCMYMTSTALYCPSLSLHTPNDTMNLEADPGGAQGAEAPP